MDMKVFAERLKDTRIRQNISAVELAQAINVNVGTIHRYERASFKSIKESRLEAIADYLSVDKEYLIGKTDEKYSLHSLEGLNTKHNIEIHTVIYLAKEIMKQKNVTLEGKPITDVSLDYIIDTMEIALEMLKRKNK